LFCGDLFAQVVLIGLTVSSASFVRALEATLQSSGSSDDNIDGIVAVAHNEGFLAGDGRPRAGLVGLGAKVSRQNEWRNMCNEVKAKCRTTKSF
jgi:hypothetical protein